MTGWSDPVEEKTGFVEAACQNYEALVEDKRVGKTATVRNRNKRGGPSQQYETQFSQRQNEAGATGALDKAKKSGY